MAETVSMQIMMRLRQIIQALSKHSKFIQENYQITVPQLICLREIHEHGPISLGALTKVVYLNNSTVTGIADRLEKRGLIRRNRISRDRRQVHVEITEKGIEFIRQAPTPLQDRFLQRLEKMDMEKITMLLWSLEVLVDMLGPEKPGTIIPATPGHLVGSPEDMEAVEDI